MVALEDTVDRRALDVGLEPASNPLAKGLERRHADAGQVWCAAEASGDHGVFRQRLRWIEPAELQGDTASRRAHQPDARDVAVGIALPHADKDLAVLKQFESPVGHGRSTQKRAKRTQLGKVRTAFCYTAQVAPMRRSSNGSYTAIRDTILLEDLPGYAATEGRADRSRGSGRQCLSVISITD